MTKDALGDRMKAYEGISQTYLMRKTPVIARLDGKAFHTFTKRFHKPYDERFHQAMWQTAITLCKEIQGVRLAYVQSDEITLLLTDWAKYNTQAYFDYRVQKMTSVSAGIATGAFIRALCSVIPEYDIQKNILPTFDSRFWNVPRHEVVNTFLWRQQDAERNSIQMLGQAYFSQKQLHRKSCVEIKAMLKDLNPALDWDKCPTPQKRGVCIVKKSAPDGRTYWEVDKDIPSFTEGYVQQYLPALFWKEE